MHSNTAFSHSCSIASAILFRMWNKDCVKEGGRGYAFYSQVPCLNCICSGKENSLQDINNEHVYKRNVEE